MTDLQDPYGVDDEQTGSPMSGRGFILSAALVALIVLAGIIVVTLNLVDDDEPSTDPTPSPSSAPTSAPADPEASVCGLQPVELSGTLPAAPSGISWQVDGLSALPSSEVHGPGVREKNAVRYCYSRTPEGALLAAAHLFGAGGLPPADRPMTREDAREWIERTTASGPGYDAALQVWPDKWDGLTRADLEEIGARGQFRGYRIVTYDGSTALIELVTLVTRDESAEGSLRMARWEMVWERGDWRVRLAPDGAYPRSTVVPDLTGYVPWAGA